MFNIDLNIEIIDIKANGTGIKEPDEYVEVKNFGKLAQTFNTWTISDLGNHTFTFPNAFTLKKGESARVYTDGGALSFGSKNAVWNNEGDEAMLRGANEAVIDKYVY